MKGFGSDNHAGIHPKLLSAMIAANQDHAPSYGTDPWTQKAEAEFDNLFKSKTRSYFVFNGTAANVTALRAITKPWQRVLCSEVAHLNVDECGAPEFQAGIKLQPLASQFGKLSLETLKSTIIRKGDQHYSQASAVSLTQPTELGTCYSVQEIKEICQWAHAEGLLVHVDGARLANAVVFLQTSFAEMLTEAGVDVVSFGGTKNGLAFGEAVVFLKPDLAREFSYIRKQSAQLPSKSRFIAAAFHEYLQSGLWREIAEHSHAMAVLLEKLVSGIPGVEITAPIQSNAVFARIPKVWVKPLRENFFFYVWNEQTFECRWMMSFDTTEEELSAFAAALKALSLNRV